MQAVDECILVNTWASNNAFGSLLTTSYRWYLVWEADVQLADGYTSVLIEFSCQSPPYLFLR